MLQTKEIEIEEWKIHILKSDIKSDINLENKEKFYFY